MSLKLRDTNDTLEVVLAVAHSTTALPYLTSFDDITASAATTDGSDGQTNGTAAVTMVAAPAASTVREVHYWQVFNADTIPHTVTVRLNNNSTLRTIGRFVLAPNECVRYRSQQGPTVYDAAGREKVASAEYTAISGRAISLYKTGTASEAVGVFYCTSKDAGAPGAWAPGTPGLAGRATDGTTAADNGCLIIPNPASGANYLRDVTLTSSVAHLHELFDVVWVNSGLVVTTTTAQTINSVAFPARDENGTADGTGYAIGLLVTTATTNAGAVANMTVSYTNQANVAGRTATLIAVAGSQFPATAVVGTVVWFHLQAGDTGVRSIQSITLGTSLVAGAVSLFVARRGLASVPVVAANIGSSAHYGQTPGVRLYNGSCVLHGYWSSATTATATAGTCAVVER